jgi:hypothetical protein
MSAPNQGPTKSRVSQHLSEFAKEPGLGPGDPVRRRSRSANAASAKPPMRRETPIPDQQFITQLADRERYRPVFQQLLDVQVECLLCSGHCVSPVRIDSISLAVASSQPVSSPAVGASS